MENKERYKNCFQIFIPRGRKNILYPEFPENWDKKVNEWGDTAADWWLENLFDNYDFWKVPHP